jgi:hypothetical protein
METEISKESRSKIPKVTMAPITGIREEWEASA